MRYTAEHIEALTNWDGMLCKPPFRNTKEKCQYYSRFIERMLWRHFTSEDWKEVAGIIHEIRVSPKLKRTTQFLLARHT